MQAHVVFRKGGASNSTNCNNCSNPCDPSGGSMYSEGKR